VIGGQTDEQTDRRTELRSPKTSLSYLHRAVKRYSNGPFVYGGLIVLGAGTLLVSFFG